MIDPTIGDELRDLAIQIQITAEKSRAYSVVSLIVANACDHILLRARYSDQIQREEDDD